MRKILLSWLLIFCTLLTSIPAFNINVFASNNTPVADVINIDYSNGNMNDVNGHILTEGTGEIVSDTGLGDSTKALRIKKIGDKDEVGYRYSVEATEYNSIKTSFTMETYFYLSSLKREQAIFSNQESGGFGFEVNNGKLFFYAAFLNESQKVQYFSTSFAQISIKTWMHAVAVYNGSTITLYINGNKVDECSGLPGSIVEANATSFYVGADTTGSNGSELALIDGSMINRARVYSSALSEDQVKELFNNVPGKKNAGITIEETINSGSITFGVVSDVHISAYDGKGNDARLKKALEYFANNGAVTTMVAGDLCAYGTDYNFTNYIKVIENCNKGSMTVHQSVGNHDRYIGYEKFANNIGDSGWAHYKINGYHFILLSPDSGSDTGIYDSSKSWLKEQLRIAQADTGDLPIFVIAHHAIKDTVFTSDEYYGNLKKDDFDDYPQVVLFTGHSHAPNNHPQSIWQGEFTAVNTATLYRVDMNSGFGTSCTPVNGENCAQGLLVTVNGSVVTIVTRDFMADADVENQIWTFDTSVAVENTSLLPYNNVIRTKESKEPYFEESASITIDRITMPNITVTFPQAKTCDSLEGGVDGDVVYYYRFEIWDSDGKLIVERNEWSDFYQIPMADTLTKVIPGLEYGTEYTMYIYPINGFGKKGAPISVEFSTPLERVMADILDVDFRSTGSVDAAGHECVVKGSPEIAYSDYISGTTARFNGDYDAYLYKFNADDYTKLEKSFTVELYYKPIEATNLKCPFAGMENGGLGFEYNSDGELCFYGNYDGNWIGVPIPVKLNQWNHIIATYNGVEIKVYLNGSLVGQATTSGKLKWPKDDSYSFAIGADVSKYPVVENASKCEIAFARIYSECLVQKADVLNVDFRTQSTEDGAGHETIVYGSPQISKNDLSGFYSAKLGDGNGYGFVLSDDDYAKIQDSFSIELYYNPTNFNNITCPFSGQEEGGFGFENDGSKLNFWVNFGGVWKSVSIPAKLNEWNHIIVTYDGMQIKAYLNGALTSSIYQSGCIQLTPYEQAKRVVIGGDTNTLGEISAHSTCEVAVARIYSSTLTEREIQECYSSVAFGGLIVSARSNSSMQTLTYGYTEGSSITYTIKNAGNTALTGITASLVDGSEYFNVVGPTVTSLDAGKSTTVTITTKIKLNVGDYLGKLQISSDENTVTEDFSQKINKANIVIKAIDQSAFVGDSVPSISNPQEGTHYTVSGLMNDDYLINTPSLSFGGNVDMSAPGAVSIKIQGASISNSSNYNAIEYRNGTLSILLSVTPTAEILDVDFNSVLSYKNSNANNATKIGQPTIKYNETIHRTTVDFNGTDKYGYKYTISDANYEKLSSGFTVELYYKPGDYINYSCPFSGQESGGFGFENNGTDVVFWICLSNEYYSVQVPTVLNEWNHVVVSYDGSLLKSYVNGTLESTSEVCGTLTTSKYAAAHCIMIGGDTDTNGNLSAINKCEIALARIYGYVLTANEVGATYGKASQGTNASRIPNAEIYGTQSQTLIVADLLYNPDKDFENPVTTYSNSLSQISNAIALATSEESKTINNGRTSFENMVAIAGFSDCVKDTPSEGDPGYATRYYTANTIVKRNGKDCNVLLIAVSDDSKDDKYSVATDFLNKENGNSTLKFDKVYCVTDEAERIYSELSSKRSEFAEYSDYIFWVVGTNRGSSVGNELARLFVDDYGTIHTTAYLFGGMNVSTLAQTSDDTSKYNSIFNIIDVDDLTTYLPLGEEYNGWGYKRWGVTIQIGLPENITNRSNLKTKIEKNYQTYTGNVDRTQRTYIDASYACYDFYNFSEANGKDIKKVIDGLYKILPTSKSYYTSTISYYNSSGTKKSTVCYEFINDLITGVMELTKGDTSTFDWNMLQEIWKYYMEIKYSSERDCDVQPLLKLILRHGLHASSISNALDMSSISDLWNLDKKKFILREALVHTIAENYLSVNSLAEPSSAWISGPLPDSSAVSILSSGAFSISGQKIFFDDQVFTVNENNDCYQLSFAYTDEESSDLYGFAQLYYASDKDNIKSISYSKDGISYTEVLFEYQSGAKQYLINVPNINGYLKIEKELTVIEKPTFPKDDYCNNLTYVYTGDEQTFTPHGFDSNTMKITGNVHTDANTTGYTVEVIPLDGYCWSDEVPCSFTWVISKADATSFSKTTTSAINAVADSTMTMKLPEIPGGASYGTLSIIDTNSVTGKITNDTLLLTVNEELTICNFDVNIAVSGGTNYNDYSIEIHVAVNPTYVRIDSASMANGNITLNVDSLLGSATNYKIVVLCLGNDNKMCDLTMTTKTISNGANVIILDCLSNIANDKTYKILILEEETLVPVCTAAGVDKN